MLSKRPLLLLLAALATCALLFLAHRRSLRLTPAFPALRATVTGEFTAGGGWYPGTPLAHATPALRAWGSWSGSDDHRGQLILGPFPAPRVLRFGVGGYPSNPGISLVVQRADASARQALASARCPRRLAC